LPRSSTIDARGSLEKKGVIAAQGMRHRAYGTPDWPQAGIRDVPGTTAAINDALTAIREEGAKLDAL
jgi:hypothetical protein